MTTFFERLFAFRNNRQEVAILYFGRASEFLMTTAERMAFPAGGCTLAQVLESLRQRSDRWADELDERHVICTVNDAPAGPFAAIEPGCEIHIFSRKSIFEP